MTTLAEKIAVMQALERGEGVEFTIIGTGRGWRAIEDPAWNWDECQYRIKPKPRPKPREIWVNEYLGSFSYAYRSEIEAKTAAGPDVIRVAIHCREVIE